MTGLDVGQLKHLVVEPALAALGLGGEAAANLLTGTALAESRGRYVQQLGGGPALGLWQMEPATHDDCWENFLRYPVGRPFGSILEGMMAHDLPHSVQMMTNLRYACGMARIRFYRVGAPLPSIRDAGALSHYHKLYYNTAAGAADAESNIPFFQQAVLA
ncbi:hypothetical protein [Gluconobacter morbifer]|nr:hypothetical protein [Gluconobacter morbifer]